MKQRSAHWGRAHAHQHFAEQSRHRALPTYCLLCEVRIMPKDRAAHRTHCPGRGKALPHDAWIGRSDVERPYRFAVAREAKKGLVRTDDEGRYLLRDVEMVIDLEVMRRG
jgi:hypothetical protein